MDRPLAGISVLIAEDDADNAEMLAAMLEYHGALVRTANSAAGVFHLVASWRPDIALLDIQMPKTDGYSLIRALRLLPAMDGVAILAVTARTSELDVARATSAGFDAHVCKPIDCSVLIALIVEASAVKGSHLAV